MFYHPEIIWHGMQQRILSIDFHPFQNQLITGGSDQIQHEVSQFDGYAKAWSYKFTSTGFEVEFKFGLRKHTNNVGVVKYSPNARFVATGSDDCSIVIWQKRLNFMSIRSREMKQMWSPKIELNGHSGEITDLKWTMNSDFIVSAGYDKKIFIWNVLKGQYVRVLEKHQKPIQGLALDPYFQRIISQGNDKAVKVWRRNKGSTPEEINFHELKNLFQAKFVKLEKETNVVEAIRDSGESDSESDKQFNISDDPQKGYNNKQQKLPLNQQNKKRKKNKSVQQNKAKKWKISFKGDKQKEDKKNKIKEKNKKEKKESLEKQQKEDQIKNENQNPNENKNIEVRNEPVANKQPTSTTNPTDCSSQLQNQQSVFNNNIEQQPLTKSSLTIEEKKEILELPSLLLPSSVIQQNSISPQRSGPNTKKTSSLQQKHFRIYIDENVPTFFRRPDFSPDGNYFAIVTATWKQQKEKSFPCALIYKRQDLFQPFMIIQTHKEIAICVRFCSKLFKRKQKRSGSLPYYMVFAIGTSNSVLVYSTENFEFLYGVGNHHYASITELAWKNDRILGISSNDRTCSFIVFQKGELGEEYIPTNEALREITQIKRYEKEDNKNKGTKETKQKKINKKQMQKNVKQKNGLVTIIQKNNDQKPEPSLSEDVLNPNKTEQSEQPKVDIDQNQLNREVKLETSNQPPKKNAIPGPMKKRIMPIIIQKFD